jgi:mannose-P-dolichol utilization defect protein 1
MDALRSALQPVTHNLPTPLYTIGNNLLGPSCYKHLVLDIDPINNPECLKLAISKGLGIGIIGASSIVKIPQLLKLVNSQSSAGVSFLSYLLETASLLITLAYNARQGNPFSTYGESALIAAQNVAIASLVLHYGGKSAGAAVFVAGLAAAGFALFKEGVIDTKTMSMLQAGAGVLGVASKLPQIFAIWQEGGTGQLSAFAVSYICLIFHGSISSFTACSSYGR